MTIAAGFSQRCPACSALLAPQAQWCGQCYAQIGTSEEEFVVAGGRISTSAQPVDIHSVDVDGSRPVTQPEDVEAARVEGWGISYAEHVGGLQHMEGDDELAAGHTAQVKAESVASAMIDRMQIDSAKSRSTLGELMHATSSSPYAKWGFAAALWFLLMALLTVMAYAVGSLL